MKRTSSLVAALLVVATTTASADPRKVLVLQSEGRADAAVRTKVDAGVLRLAKTWLAGADVSSGDTTLTDAAAAVGCKPETPQCREEILGMLSVDELVYATLTSKPGGTEVEVHRTVKGGATTDAKMLLAAGASADKLDGIAPLFATDAGTTPTNPTTTDPTTNPTTTNPPVTDPTTTPPVIDPTTTPDPTPPVVTTPTPNPAVTVPVDEGPSPRRRRLELAGMIGGGAMILIGFMCWGSASDIQSQIDEAPTQTKPQLDALADLEARGDAYAGWGNVLFLGGAVLGGISTYFFIKDRRAGRHSTSARIAPTVFDHGAGLALTFGAAP